MNCLAIDTSTEILSVALSAGDRVYEATRNIGLKHSEILMPLIDSLIREAGIEPKALNLVICAKGPGSFTGLRIGMATAKGIAAGAESHIVSVPTLDVIAYGLTFYDGIVVPVIDAKKKCYYTAFYMGGERITKYLDVDCHAIMNMLQPYEKVLLTGPHAPGLYKELPEACKYVLDPCHKTGRSVHLLELGIRQYETSGPDVSGDGPLYVRRSEAEISLLDKKDDG
ncbi:MAG: tRNA (adenosine(37)-N6)-threonylcarbamoyltransferase complex dimerization subunit type 1 TsaB [Spirochaetota bacterium]